MSVIEMREAQDTLAADETVVAQLSNGTRLIRTDDGTGIVRPDADFPEPEREYESWADARLFFGLIQEIGGYWDVQPQSPTKHIPIQVVRAGKDAVAAYLAVGCGTTYPRRYVARQLEVSEQTVSNYWGRIRWAPDE